MSRRKNSPVYHVVDDEGRSLCGTRRPFWQAAARGLTYYSQYMDVPNRAPLALDLVCKNCQVAVERRYNS